MVTAAEQQAAQAAIAEHLAHPVENAWRLLTVADLRGTLPELVGAIAAVVQLYGLASATLAARYYEAERMQAGIRGTYLVDPVSPASYEQIDEAVRWATKGLWGKKPNTEAAKTLTLGIAEKYTLDAGRQTIIRAVQQDRKSHGWARVVEPGACSFCLILAIRGAVYRSEQSADFRAHDHCRCHVQPLFGVVHEPSAQVRQAKAIYDDIKRTAHGPLATRKAFRDAIEASRHPQ